MHEILKTTTEKMEKSVSRLEKEYTSIRAGRANPSVLNKIMVDYYDTPTPINQLAAVSVSEARILVISPWDVSTLSLIVKAIQQSDLGINPVDDGKVIRIIFPQLTEERRRSIAKEISAMLENGKVSIRNIRHEAMDKLKSLKKDKDNKMSEDEILDLEDEVQKIVSKYTKEMEKLSELKTKEVMEL